MTDDEIIRNFILPARAFVENQRKMTVADRIEPKFTNMAFSLAKSGLEKLTQLAHSNENKNETVEVGKVTKNEIEILSRNGIEISEEFKHTADMYAVRHTLNRHGDAATEKSLGQLPITDSDIENVAEIVADPDALVIGAKNPRKQDLVGYLKRLSDGSILYFEEVRTGGKALAMASMRKYPGATDFDTIVRRVVPSYAQSDTGDVRIIYPGGKDSQAAFSRSLGDTLSSAANSARDVNLPAGYKVADLIGSTPGKLHWWGRNLPNFSSLSEIRAPNSCRYSSQ
jgi:hypothetical protein